ncbi:MAG: phage integrase N-terminal SAM-like domain-containing protein [Burkholderiaceae bacterium]|nr:phage integrase N-terminal SAM-like domain-containing protein [Burkholderiaceae bacterium]
MKPGTPALRSTRLLDQVRESIRYFHHSRQTEKAYLYWVRFFIRWHGRAGVMRHPHGMGAEEVPCCFCTARCWRSTLADPSDSLPAAPMTPKKSCFHSKK